MARVDLSDAEWAVIGPLLPSERGRWARPAQDNRRHLSASQWDVACAAGRLPLARHARALWQVELGLCALPALGRTRRLGCALETSVELGLTDDWQHMIDSTSIRGHSQAAGAKGDS